MSIGSPFTPRNPRPSILSAWNDAPSEIGWQKSEHMSSTAWSTARIPVERNSHSGVWMLARGSSSTVFGVISGWPKLCFSLTAVSVHPAEALYSPAESVVGMQIVRTEGGSGSARVIVPSAATRLRSASS